MRHIKIWDLTWVTGRKRESHPLAPIVAAPARFLTHAASPIKLFTTWQVAKRGDVVCSWLAIHEQTNLINLNVWIGSPTKKQLLQNPSYA
ncbi:hypothetical protein CF596_13945 [Acinetobacter sp. YT-02]|jgi:hypothetical protein|nr:hypothetical protein CF596_13945 [Acinetobacter sp. YT-02]